MESNARIGAVLRRMAEDEIELLIACSNGLHLPDRPDPVVHLSGYCSQTLRPAAVYCFAFVNRRCRKCAAFLQDSVRHLPPSLAESCVAANT